MMKFGIYLFCFFILFNSYSNKKKDSLKSWAPIDVDFLMDEGKLEVLPSVIPFSIKVLKNNDKTTTTYGYVTEHCYPKSRLTIKSESVTFLENGTMKLNYPLIFKNKGQFKITVTSKLNPNLLREFEYKIPCPVSVEAVYDTNQVLSYQQDVFLNVAVKMDNGKLYRLIKFPFLKDLVKIKNHNLILNNESVLKLKGFMTPSFVTVNFFMNTDTTVTGTLNVRVAYSVNKKYNFSGEDGRREKAGTDAKNVLLEVRKFDGSARFYVVEIKVNNVLLDQYVVDSEENYSFEFILKGGNGGSGRNGSRGSRGCDGTATSPPSPGGNGGNGSSGGKGGNGGIITLFTEQECLSIINHIKYNNEGGLGGEGGIGGSGGSGGKYYSEKCSFCSSRAASGRNGIDGANGAKGLSGGDIVIKVVTTD